MAENSAIEWTDHTFNPWIGCTKVSPGCDHCYAERDMAGRLKVVQWGPHGERVRTKPANWSKPLTWNRRHDEFFAQHGRRQRVFCASLADVFDNEVDPTWRADLLELIDQTPNLDWLLLTKRIGNVADMLPNGWLMQHTNVWLGASIVNQVEADRDIPKLVALHAHVKFLSMEPLLGPVDLRGNLPGERALRWHRPMLNMLDWVIVGGESGPGARPMHPDWARDLRDQCAAASVPFLFKQWGEWTPGVNVERHSGTVDTAHWWNGEWIAGREDLATVDGNFEDEPDLYRVGKKAAGRQLDGSQHDGYPGVK
jgi:protein gp37